MLPPPESVRVSTARVACDGASDIPGGAADWDEQQRVYASGAHGINEHHRTSPIPHPYESYLEPDAFQRELSDRLASYRRFLQEWPGDRVLELLKQNNTQ